MREINFARVVAALNGIDSYEVYVKQLKKLMKNDGVSITVANLRHPTTVPENARVIPVSNMLRIVNQNTGKDLLVLEMGALELALRYPIKNSASTIIAYPNVSLEPGPAFPVLYASGIVFANGIMISLNEKLGHPTKSKY